MSAARPLEVRPESPRSRPTLIFFYSATSGRCRRGEGFLAQVLQRRRNHETFKLVSVSVDEQPALAAKFGVDYVPTIAIVEQQKLRLLIVDPHGCRELEAALGPWLKG